MNPPVILGVDPGARGAIAALDAATGALLWVEDMPVIDGIVSGALVADLLLNEIITTAWIEQVGGWRGQAAGAAFKFGASYGTVLGVLAALRAPHELVPANVWKPAAKITKDKATARRKAIERWPEHSALFKLVKHDGRAEAALIGRHGWLQHREQVGR